MAGVDCCFDILDIFARYLGPALVLLASLIISFCTFIYFKIAIWFFSSLLIGASLSILGVFILLNSVSNYFKAVRTSPGIPPLAADSAESSGGQYSQGLSNRLKQYSGVQDDDEISPMKKGNIKICSKCDRIRPPRTHHCSVCRHCIVRFDHHCPWIYNCVGGNNYRYFYLFLVWTTLAIVFFLSSSWPAMNHALDWMILGPDAQRFGSSDRMLVIMSFAVAGAVGIGLVAFLSFHTYLVLTNQTTLEWATRGGMKDEVLRRSGKFRRNAYDIGKDGNWHQVLGFRIKDLRWLFCWLTPSCPSRSHIGLELANVE